MDDKAIKTANRIITSSRDATRIRAANGSYVDIDRTHGSLRLVCRAAPPTARTGEALQQSVVLNKDTELYRCTVARAVYPTTKEDHPTEVYVPSEVIDGL